MAKNKADAVHETRGPMPKTGNPNTGKTMEKLSEGSAKGQGAAEGSHYSKARRQTQTEVKYR